MKRFLGLSVLIYMLLSGMMAAAQCPSDPTASCTSTISASSVTNVTVAAGQVVCVTGGIHTGTFNVQNGGILLVSGGTIGPQVAVQNGGNLVVSGGILTGSASLPAGASMFIKNNPALNGTLAMSGGTLNVLSGGTLAKDISATAASTINNCGTLSGTRNFNTNITLNNYSASTITLSTGGNTLNNYADNVTIAYNNVNTTNTFNNYGTGVNFSITGAWNSGMTFNNAAGAALTVTSVPGGAMPSATVFNNAGTLTYSPVLNTNGATFNNAATGTFNLSSSASANRPNITNDGTMNVSGTFYLAGNTTTNNGTMTFSDELRLDGGTLNLGANSTTTTKTLYKNNGSINMYDHSVLNIVQNVTTWNGTAIHLVSGCASVLGSTTPSTTNINATFLDNANINFCGAPPAQSPSYIAITSVTNSASSPGRYRIALSSGPATNGYVQISGVTGVSDLNGYWQVINNGNGTWDLIGSTYTAGAVISGSQVIVDQTKLKLGPGYYLGYSGCSNPCAPLPITLLSFTAEKEDAHVVIEWVTLQEKNNQSYTVERSADGIHFESVVSLAGNKNSSQKMTYTQYDFSPLPGVTYYRLKQTDMDQTHSYSSVVAVDSNSEIDWTIYPNPSTTGDFTILSAFADNEIVAVTVTDMTGNTVRSYDESSYEQQMEISNLGMGLYVVSIQTVTGQKSKKVIVQ
ncbi:T9SS type A sorting domain-containing protein [Cytophaga hutchinsonii]|uniref:CHU large protein, possible SAP or adhesin AidA-related protein n=1 Tax=Cytophaga hutchinsonii (strain ATCC 33406 / DSM 1761 / CIP 103989 / NBRC 15051 / NCIMB 9469 / D465) TaxID=269798 RepID=A0A6N4SSS1_CYTH3|nr:T9SS type A sorting domain-containing protein [Cytophaga hutchinsonii]ABG59402.1 CHU large protein, possible SAP or adhesin AidA-related protein [Cytophaga hutchinsonii ATCC 33406]SFX93051.1 Por secretion system C-terminal sorting domain-containing protein [Cytophaga hutchinsonii ATCC 33406]